MNLQQTSFFILCYALPMGLIGQINAPCPSAIIPTPIDVAVWSFSLDSYPDSTTVSWLVNGEAISSDSAFTQSFMAGNYLIEAMVSAPQCPSTSTLTYNLQTLACGITIEAAEQESGFFTFTALGYPEEYPMYWQLGDDTLIWETWVVDHAFSPGMHEVCAWYSTAFCPDTVSACIAVEVFPPPCTAAFISDDTEPMLLQCASFETDPNASFLWYVDGALVSEMPDPAISLYPGIRTVCLEVNTPTCSDTHCDTVVILCAAPYNTIEMTVMSYGNASGEDAITLGGTNALYEIFNENLPVAVGDTLRWLYCTDVNCFVAVAWRNQFAPMQADSIVIVSQFLAQNATPTRLVLYPLGEASSVDDVLGQDCIWYGVDETNQATRWEVILHPGADFMEFRGDAVQVMIADAQGRCHLPFTRVISGDRLDVHTLSSGMYLVIDQAGNCKRVYIR